MSSESKIIIAAFTHNGINLALRLACSLDARVFVPERFTCVNPTLELISGSLTEWAGKFFHESRALIFVSSCGIAVRAISAHVQSKLSDPAVIVIDEAGNYVIPILSGHVGVAVTDGIISAPYPVTLYLRPKVLVLGVGCNRGVDPDEFESAAQAFMKSSGASVLSLKALASIDIKENEPALIKFSKAHNIPLITFSASELQELPGNFTSSQRVLEITGTDYICERACVKAAGENAVLLRNKFICDGMTFALARII